MRKKASGTRFMGTRRPNKARPERSKRHTGTPKNGTGTQIFLTKKLGFPISALGKWSRLDLTSIFDEIDQNDGSDLSDTNDKIRVQLSIYCSDDILCRRMR